tara:strand:+ start:2369 stop:3625 length:1257 start_codon:yes stop_codon:yes gene_type:complete
MSSTSTTWSTDSNTKATSTSSTTQNVSLDGTLTVAGATQLNSTLTIGVDDTGYDVKFFGATSGKYMEWDESADQLDVTGSLDVTGNTSMIGTLTVGVDNTGHDVKFFGATSSRYLLWDESNDLLLLRDNVKLMVGNNYDMSIYHDGSNSYIENSTGTLKIATEESGIAVSIGHTTSETTINDNLTVTGNLKLGDDGVQLSGAAGYIEIQDVDSSNNFFLILDSGLTSQDSSVTFAAGNSVKWNIGNDGSDSHTFKMSTNNAGILSTNTQLQLDTSGNLTIEGKLVEGRTVIKIPAHHFIINNDVGTVARLDDDGSNFGYRAGNAASEFYAFVDIPLGYTATKVRIYGSDTANEVEVYTFDVTDGTIGSEISNSGLTVGDDTALASNHAGSDTNLLMIKVAVAATDDLIYSGIVTIQST